MVEYDDIKIGGRVAVKGGFGTEPETFVTVTEKELDIKNGRAGISYVEDGGNTRWAYLHQVTRVFA
jgi:predicted Rossmann-fold nucleotide-binding protein